MIAPERWYEHQRNYQKYGFDMKPQPQRSRRRKKRRVVKLNIGAATTKKLAFSTVLAIGITLIMLIIVTAYSAGVRYDINNTIKANQTLMGEIETLQVKVYSANNINYIEGKAIGEMGMVYPSTESSVYITQEDMPEVGFADIIKQHAYN